MTKRRNLKERTVLDMQRIKKKNLKLFLLILIILVMPLVIKSRSIAMSDQNSENDEVIDGLLIEFSEKNAMYFLNESSGMRNEIELIEKKLYDIGVKALNEDELTQFLEEKDSPLLRVSRPGSTNTVKWFLYTNHELDYKGKKYDVQRLVAVGNNPGGMLVTGQDNVKFYSNKQLIANGAVYAVSLYAQKAIGLIPIIRWTPYEVLFSSSSSNTFNSNYVTHRCVSSIEFFYVKPAATSDSNYVLCKFSNRLSIAANAHGAAVVNSNPTTYSVQMTETISSDYYCSTSRAMKAYANNRTYYDYIPFYNIYSYDKKYSKAVYVPNPLAGPGQIY